jgi:hypothetical protein
MKTVTIPGVAWAALIVGLTGLLGGWLQQWVQEPWVPLAIILLDAIAKAVEIYLGPTPVTRTTMAGERQPSAWLRWLLG